MSTSKKREPDSFIPPDTCPLIDFAIGQMDDIHKLARMYGEDTDGKIDIDYKWFVRSEMMIEHVLEQIRNSNEALRRAALNWKDRAQKAEASLARRKKSSSTTD